MAAGAQAVNREGGRVDFFCTREQIHLGDWTPVHFDEGDSAAAVAVTDPRDRGPGEGERSFRPRHNGLHGGPPAPCKPICIALRPTGAQDHGSMCFLNAPLHRGLNRIGHGDADRGRRRSVAVGVARDGRERMRAVAPGRRVPVGGVGFGRVFDADVRVVQLELDARDPDVVRGDYLHVDVAGNGARGYGSSDADRRGCGIATVAAIVAAAAAGNQRARQQQGCDTPHFAGAGKK